MNLFMILRKLNQQAFSPLPAGFLVRSLRPDELDWWKEVHFDTREEALSQRPFMDDYFARVYQPRQDLFFERCQVLCNAHHQPLGTAFLWPTTTGVNTLHWFKVQPAFQGLGLGRALLSQVLSPLTPEDLPLYLHTHPECLPAIHLYSSFGFEIFKGPRILERANDWQAGYKYLKKHMKREAAASLNLTLAPKDFYEKMAGAQFDEF